MTPETKQEYTNYTQAEVNGLFSSAGNPIIKGKARCPCHNDKHASMSVDVKDGRILVHCYVCGPERQGQVFKCVLEQLNIEKRYNPRPLASKKESSLFPDEGLLERTTQQMMGLWEGLEEVGEEGTTYYCASKSISPLGVRRYPKGVHQGSTAVPMYAGGGLGPLCGIQRIAARKIDGKNKFNESGSLTEGSGFIVGWRPCSSGGSLNDFRDSIIVVCEGYSTAASVYELAQELEGAQGIGEVKVFAAVSFGIGNLMRVARALAQVLEPVGVRVAIGADSDASGMAVAIDAARAGWSLVIPDLGSAEGNDWNDAANSLEKTEVLRQLGDALSQVKRAPTQQVKERALVGTPERATEKEGGRKKKQKKGGYKDYLDLLRQAYPEREPRLDIVSGEIKVFEAGQWVRPDLLILRSGARESDGFFDHTAILDHLRKCAREMTPELLLDVASVWDGVDRIGVFSAALSAETFSKDDLRELLEYWLVGVIRKAFNPEEMNHVFVLQGCSGCGKDVWVRRLLRTFTAPWDPSRTVVDGYVTNMSISPFMAEEDWARYLCRYLVCNISEFDKVKSDARGAAVFKSITTAEKVAWRPKYEEEVVARPVRASIVASLNPKEINEDSAGARRYIPIELVGHPYPLGAEGAAIDWSYGDIIDREGEEFYRQLRAQIMLGVTGERKALGWATADSLREVQEELTPADPIDSTIAAILEDAREQLRVGTLTDDIMERGETVKWQGEMWGVRRVSNKAFAPLVREHCEVSGESKQRVTNRLGQYRLLYRTKTARGCRVPFERWKKGDE